jgi:hypothetical protein
MSFATQSVVCVTWVLGLLIFVVWTSSLATLRARPAVEKGGVVSYMLLALYVLVPAIFGDYTRNPTHLATQGLSVQNTLQVLVTMSAVAWAVWLFATRTVAISNFVAGVNFWIGLMLALWGLSAIWSVWPMMTVFRTMELGAFWVLSVHLFSGRPPIERLTRCLFVGVSLSLVFPLSYLVQHPGLNAYQVFVKIRENEAGMMAGVLMVVVFYRLIILGQMRSLILLVIAAAAFAWFSSLGSFVALVFATMSLLILNFTRNVGRLTQLLAVAFVLPLAAFLLYELVYGNPDAATWLAWASGKDPRNIADATGRAVFWRQILQVARNNKFGYGFGAGERLLYQLLSSFPTQVSQHLTNAHNGFLAAWLSAGWLGAWALAFTFVGAIFDAARRSYNDCSYMLSVIIFLGINNLTLPTVGGGVFGPGWFIMMVLACAGSIPEASRSADRFRQRYRLSNAMR